MQLLLRHELVTRMGSKGPQSLFIDPILDQNQIGEVSVDLRLGYDFLVSIFTRKSFISVDSALEDFRSIESYFQPTRRDVGDRFILYPNQVVLTTTFEYVAVPNDLVVDICPRSSYSRLGVHFGGMIQPGYRGCLPLELINLGNNPIELIVGSRIAQCRFSVTSSGSNYDSSTSPRKYVGTTRPTVSRAPSDEDIALLTAARRVR